MPRKPATGGGLSALVEAELAQPIDPSVSKLGEAIAAKHGQASRAVLFYGSCLREKQLDGLMLDFYLIVSDYRAAYGKGWLALANRLIPPNVFYFEADGLRAKYAVLSEADFAHECGPNAWTVSTAARFAQPSRLAWSADGAARAAVVDIVASAAPTLLGWTVATTGRLPALDLWRAAFARTFAAELRAERLDRSASIVDSDRPRYERFGDAVLREISAAPSRSGYFGRRWWKRKQLKGKLYSIPRLAKASATFAGGADYIAWKINRHAGTQIELKPWQRRWPLVTALIFLPRLLKSGAVR